MAGQTINDRLLAARHSLAGQGLAKSVCKATTEEMIGPKKKHLDYLVHCTNEPNVSIPHLANLLVERSQNANWVVVYKALITVHHLLAYGNERFMQYLASSNSTFNLSNFLDKGGVQGAVGARIGYDMSPFIRRYAKYLNEKALSYRTVAFDFCKMKRGKEEGTIRTMNADKLLKTLPVLQAQLDALLEFDCTANDLTNGVISMCFTLLFRDLIRLFACYNDGIINLLEKYFDMNKKQCRDALDLYKKFLVRMDRVGEFLKVAENMGIDKGDLPDLTKAPSSLLDALEGHLAFLEGKKGSAANTPTQTASNQKNVKSGVTALSSTSFSFGTAAASARFDNPTNGIDEAVKALALAEEEAIMNQYKSKLQSPGGNNSSTNPFLSSPPHTQASAPIVDLFGSPTGDARSNDNYIPSGPTKASDDLLQLGNPFADMFGAPAPAPAPAGGNMWMSNGFNGTATAPTGGAPSQPGNNAFVSDSNFSSVFGNTEPAATDPSMPNPFLLTETVGGDQHPEITGGKSGAPMRPPPPISAGGSVTSSPAHVIPGQQHQAQPKSAFDDLNESIRMALGGSPAKVPMGQPHQPQSIAGTASAIPGGAGQQQQISGYGATAQSAMFASPAKQSLVGGFDALGDVLKPGNIAAGSAQTGGLALGTQQQQQQQSGGSVTHQQTNSGKVLTGDLDSSLASLAENLTINKSASAQVKGVQWNSPKNAAKPGANWTPQPMAATTGAGYRPMAQGMTVSPAPSTIHPLVHAPYPVISPYMQQGMTAPMRPPPMGMGGPMVGAGAPMGMGMPMNAMPNMAQQQPIPGQPTMMMPQQQSNTAHQQQTANIQLDPFGAL